ncbi:GyrI-like domain-containing protein [Microbacterium sp. 22242]|uniref:GyrI-like domain-containing protein n=1 Tax=Microbacterium sp. 22242 TaxID=3453896 RepID=UPI003F83AD22
MSVLPEEPLGLATPLDLSPAPLAVVRYDRLRLDRLGEVFDPAYAALGQAVEDGAIAVTGPALAIYHGDPMDVFDLEVGFPVVSTSLDPLSIDGVRIEASELPSGPALASTVIGPYDGLGAAWGRLHAECAVQGHQPAGIWIEVYVSDPRTTAAEHLRTDLILPVLR